MFCNKCGKEIPNDSRVCKFCGSAINQQQTVDYNVDTTNTVKIKKKLYQQWWFWLIIVFLFIGVVAVTTEETGENIATVGNTNTTTPREELPEVLVIDFTEMPKDVVEAWFKTSNIDGSITEEYSNTVKKGSIIKQSIEPKTIIHEGDKVVVTYSLGREPTTEEKNALRKAESYSSTMHMSKKGIYNQLTSQFEGFSKSTAQYAIDNIEANWNENALEKAKSYQTTMNMSKKAIYNQLISTFEGFTKSEAQYAIDHLDD